LGGSFIEVDGSTIYKTNGQVIHGVTKSILGTFLLPDFGQSVLPDPGINRIFFLAGSGNFLSLLAMDKNTMEQKGILELPEGNGFSTRNLVRWSQTGMAFRVYNGSTNFGGYSGDDKVVIFQTELTNPSAGVNPAPGIQSFSPALKTVGDSSFLLTVNGTGFVPGAVVLWKGSQRTTTFLSPNQLQAAIPGTDLIAGNAAITVLNPTPGGGLSASASFPVNGTTLSFAPPTLDFGSVISGARSAPTDVTVRNNSNVAVNIASVLANGAFQQENTCQPVLPASGECVLSVRFTPTAFGPQSGTIQIATDTADSPATVVLNGVGTDLIITFDRRSRSRRSGNVEVISGKSVTFEVQVTGRLAPDERVSLSCSGAPVGSQCLVEDPTLALDSGSNVARITLLTSRTAALRLRSGASGTAEQAFALRITARVGQLTRELAVPVAIVKPRSVRLQ
jgi:hypothetical protein